MGLIQDLLKNLPLNAVLRDRIAGIEAELDRLREENGQLQAEVSRLQTYAVKLEKELSKTKTTADEFAEYRGVRIRKRPDGSFDKSMLYCFHCYSPLSSEPMMNLIFCSKCGYEPSLKFKEKDQVFAQLQP